MSAGPSSPSPVRLAPQAAWALSLALAVAVVLADALAPADVVVPVICGIPVVVAAWSRNVRLIWGVTAVLLVLTFLMFFWRSLPAHGQAVGVVSVNRLLSAVTTVAIAALMHWRVRDVDTLDEQRATISLQSASQVEAIRHERQRFEAVFRTMPFGMAVAEDPAGSTVRFNPAAAAMFGVPLDENVSPFAPPGSRLKRYLFHNGRPVTDKELPLIRALRGSEVRNDEIDVVLPTGQRYALLVSASPIYDNAGKVAGAVCSFADIMPQKNLQRELENRRREAEEANVRKTRFLAAVSHDIRTPANAINLMAEVIGRMASNPALASQIPEMAQKLRANALALVGLISEVLDLARFDAGKVDLQESEFSLAALIEDECRQLQPLAQEKGLELSAEPPRQPIWMRTDRVKLGRVLSNLIGNAVKFTEAGRVQVSADITPERLVRIRVHDTGMGIAAENVPRIFDEFTQLRNPERDSTKGTGLGLAICRRLIEVMGGEITVESRPGEGSTFTVTFPPSRVVLRLDATPPAGTASPSEAAPGSAPPPLSGLRVLLVEDHATTREGMWKILRGEGATVTATEDGRTALRLLRQEPVDVILLDMMLPDVDGREVLKILRQQRSPSLRAVVVMTGDLTPERRQEILDLGADALLEKPVNVDQLMATLRSLEGGGAKPS